MAIWQCPVGAFAANARLMVLLWADFTDVLLRPRMSSRTNCARLLKANQTTGRETRKNLILSLRTSEQASGSRFFGEQIGENAHHRALT